MKETPKKIIELMLALEKEYVGNIYVSHQYIADLLNVCRRTVTRWLRYLRERYYLTWVRRYRKNAGNHRLNSTQTTNRYYIFKKSRELKKLGESAVKGTPIAKLSQLNMKSKGESNGSLFFRDAIPQNKNGQISGDVKGLMLAVAVSTMVTTQAGLSASITKITAAATAAIQSEKLKMVDIDTTEAKIFLETWQDEQITFQTFHENPNLPKKYGPQILQGKFDDLKDELIYLNKAGHGIYCTANKCEGKRKAENITKVRGYVLDLDGAATNSVDNFMKYTPATMIIETSPGKYQMWWQGSGCPLHNFREMQQGLAKRFGGDIKVCDLPRVFRVPGFYHQKNEPFRSTLVNSDKTKVYHYKKLRKQFLRIEKEQPRQQYQQTTDSRILGASKGERNNSLFKMICGMIHRKINYASCESAVIEFANKCSPSLPTNEALYTLKAAWRRYT